MGTVVNTTSSTRGKKKLMISFFTDASSHHGHGHTVSHALSILCRLECLRIFSFLTSIVLAQNIVMCTIVHFTVSYRLQTGYASTSEWWHHLKSRVKISFYPWAWKKIVGSNILVDEKGRGLNDVRSSRIPFNVYWTVFFLEGWGWVREERTPFDSWKYFLLFLRAV